MTAVHHFSRLLAAAFVLAATSAFAADDGAWTVSKSSGEVWITSTGAQPASLNKEEALKRGDTIRTGKNGRVLLKRGEETMMISPNSVVGVPAEAMEGRLPTTIFQQAGSILLEVEKRNVKHFEVETPYLAAVVKGTQFRVTVNGASTSVDVIRGQVEVADLRTGQIAQVKPGQHATTFANGKGGLSLGGSGTFSPIEQGKPRAPTIERVPVPRAGLTAPRNAAIGHAIQPTGPGARGDKASDKASHRAGVTMPKHSGIRISSAIGEVKVNVHKVTHGLARDKSAVHGGNRGAANKDTVWASSGSGTNSAASSINPSNVAATSAGAATSTNTSTASSVTSTVAAVTGSGNSGGNGNGNGNGNNGNGNNGANGNGHDNNRYGDKHSDNGNGNGNGNGHKNK